MKTQPEQKAMRNEEIQALLSKPITAESLEKLLQIDFIDERTKQPIKLIQAYKTLNTQPSLQGLIDYARKQFKVKKPEGEDITIAEVQLKIKNLSQALKLEIDGIKNRLKNIEDALQTFGVKETDEIRVNINSALNNIRKSKIEDLKIENLQEVLKQAEEKILGCQREVGNLLTKGITVESLEKLINTKFYDKKSGGTFSLVTEHQKHKESLKAVQSEPKDPTQDFFRFIREKFEELTQTQVGEEPSIIQKQEGEDITIAEIPLEKLYLLNSFEIELANHLLSTEESKKIFANDNLYKKLHQLVLVEMRDKDIDKYEEIVKAAFESCENESHKVELQKEILRILDKRLEKLRVKEDQGMRATISNELMTRESHFNGWDCSRRKTQLPQERIAALQAIERRARDKISQLEPMNRSKAGPTVKALEETKPELQPQLRNPIDGSVAREAQKIVQSMQSAQPDTHEAKRGCFGRLFGPRGSSDRGI